jgi:predicted nucleotidyltransferase
MLTRETILNHIHLHLDEIKTRFSVSRIGLFGSFARDVTTPASDIDILIEFINPTYDNYMDLKFFLEDLFQGPVDLVMLDTIKPRLKPYISQEVVYA